MELGSAGELGAAFSLGVGEGSEFWIVGLVQEVELGLRPVEDSVSVFLTGQEALDETVLCLGAGGCPFWQGCGTLR